MLWTVSTRTPASHSHEHAMRTHELAPCAGAATAKIAVEPAFFDAPLDKVKAAGNIHVNEPPPEPNSVSHPAITQRPMEYVHATHTARAEDTLCTCACAHTHTCSGGLIGEEH